MRLLTRLTRLFSRAVPMPSKPRYSQQPMMRTASPATTRTASPLFKALLDDVSRNSTSAALSTVEADVVDPAMHGEPGYALAASELAHKAGAAVASKLVEPTSAVALMDAPTDDHGHRESSTATENHTKRAEITLKKPFEFKSSRTHEPPDRIEEKSVAPSASSHAEKNTSEAASTPSLTVIAKQDNASHTPPESKPATASSQGLYFGPSPNVAPAKPKQAVKVSTVEATQSDPNTPVNEPLREPAPASDEMPIVSTVQKNIDKHLEELRSVVDRKNTTKDSSTNTTSSDEPRYAGSIGFVPFSDRNKPTTDTTKTDQNNASEAYSSEGGVREPATPRYPRIHNPHITFQSKSGMSDDDAKDASARPARPVPGRHDPMESSVTVRDDSDEKAETPVKPARPTLIEENDDESSFVGSVASLAGVGSLADLARKTNTGAGIDPKQLRELQITATEILGALRRVGEQLDQQQASSEKLLSIVERMPAMLGTVPLLHDAQEEMSRAVRTMEQTIASGNTKADVLTARQTETMAKQTGVLRELEQSVTSSATTHSHVANAMTDLHTAFTGVRGSNEKLQSAMEAIAKRQDKREYALAKLVRRAQFTAMVAFLVAFFSVAAAAFAIALALSPELRQALGL
ncbi:MAG: hypothetical protein H6815_04340 [Phycisphaeraceae bacterium]|nr:hypothetical protein [Phycisphaerales bacterium]MCB9859661.1 hypothetical protein [Phycisphaeraceae bacterium]